MIFAFGPIWRFLALLILIETSFAIIPSISRFSANMSDLPPMDQFMTTVPAAILRSLAIMTPLSMRTSPPAIFTSPEALHPSAILPPTALISPVTGPCIWISHPAMMRSPLIAPSISMLPPVTIALSPIFPCIWISHPATIPSPATLLVIDTLPPAA